MALKVPILVGYLCLATLLSSATATVGTPQTASSKAAGDMRWRMTGSGRMAARPWRRAATACRDSLARWRRARRENRRQLRRVRGTLWPPKGNLKKVFFTLDTLCKICKNRKNGKNGKICDSCVEVTNKVSHAVFIISRVSNNKTTQLVPLASHIDEVASRYPYK